MMARGRKEYKKTIIEEKGKEKKRYYKIDRRKGT